MWGHNKTLLEIKWKPESFSSLLVFVIGKTDKKENLFVKKTNIQKSRYITSPYGKTRGNAC